MSPKLSIIMTAYNSEELIRRAITSVLNQTFSDLELLIVNDGSQDNTLEVVNSIQDDRIRLLDNVINSGTYFSRNLGMLHAKGDIIAFVDSDDLVSPNRFKRILDYMEQHKNILYVETHYVRFLEKSKELWFRNFKRGVGFAIIRRQVINELGYFVPVRAGGDTEYADRVNQFYGPEKSVLLLDHTYWASKRDNNLTSLIELDGPRRQQLLDYAKDVFHQKDNLYVAFPYEETLLEEFSKLKLFAGIESGREQNIKIVERQTGKRVAPDAEQLQLMLHFSEKCMEQFYTNYLDSEREWQRFFSKKRTQIKIAKLKHFTSESMKKMVFNVKHFFS